MAIDAKSGNPVPKNYKFPPWWNDKGSTSRILIVGMSQMEQTSGATKQREGDKFPGIFPRKLSLNDAVDRFTR